MKAICSKCGKHLGFVYSEHDCCYPEFVCVEHQLTDLSEKPYKQDLEECTQDGDSWLKKTLQEVNNGRRES